MEELKYYRTFCEHFAYRLVPYGHGLQPASRRACSLRLKGQRRARLLWPLWGHLQHVTCAEAQRLARRRCARVQPSHPEQTYAAAGRRQSQEPAQSIYQR
eukprot:scaffold224468_cov31-Tisochrysis_lutea.AAC.2